jgi:hypothetical protein
MSQTIAESLIEEGVAKGQVLANRETLRQLLTSRFGPLPETLSQRIEAASNLIQLRAAFEQSLKIQRLDELRL